MIASRLARTPVALPYPRPEACSEIGAARAKDLCGFRLSKFRADERRTFSDADNMRTLEGVVCDKGQGGCQETLQAEQQEPAQR